ncbi:TonB-dependent receptor, partial [Acidithiobacillus ferridurans]|nr:TonB-dependent receptor [Acidithiobacillus ferridurans]
PPTDFKIYRMVNGQLVFGGYGLLARATANHVFNSPYFQWRRKVGPVTFTAGARYLMEQTPSFSVYNTAGIPDASYANALNLATSINSARSVEGRTFYQWLPYFSAVYAVNPDL